MIFRNCSFVIAWWQRILKPDEPYLLFKENTLSEKKKTHSPCCQSFLTIKNIYSANLLAFLLLSQNHFYILSLLYRHISMRLSNGNPSLYKTNSLIFLLHIHSMSLSNNPCMFLPKANLMLYLYMISEATFDSFASYMLYKQSLSFPKLNPTP